MQITEVILVDEQDRPVGSMEKLQAHREGILHRAFSVFIFNSRGEMLLQQRAAGKYHSGGLWTNACCSHPFPGEETVVAAKRRLKEEMGFETELERIFHFVYKAGFDNGLTEHEFDHVFAGKYEGEIDFDPGEVMTVAWCSVEDIRHSLATDPERFTAWFRLAFPNVVNWLSR